MPVTPPLSRPPALNPGHEHQRPGLEEQPDTYDGVDVRKVAISSFAC